MSGVYINGMDIMTCAEEIKCLDCKHRSFFPNEICPHCYHSSKYDPKPQTNADRIRAMSNEEIEQWFWWMHKEMMNYTDSHIFVHNWLEQEATQ